MALSFASKEMAKRGCEEVFACAVCATDGVEKIVNDAARKARAQAGNPNATLRETRGAFCEARGIEFFLGEMGKTFWSHGIVAE